MPGYPSAAIALAFNFADDDDEAVETTNNARKTKHRHIGSVNESDADEDGDLSSPGTGSVNPAPPLSLAAARPNGYVAPSSVTANPYAATSFTDIFPALDPIHPGFYSADLDGLGPRTNGVEDQDVDGYDEGEETRTRGDGQAFVKQRKITAQLDTTDRMIVNLKTKNYPNERVAEELRKLGLTNYDPKTVGSRFIRLENAIAEHEAQRLEDELTDWHEEDVSKFAALVMTLTNNIRRIRHSFAPTSSHRLRSRTSSNVPRIVDGRSPRGISRSCSRRS